MPSQSRRSICKARTGTRRHTYLLCLVLFHYCKIWFTHSLSRSRYTHTHTHTHTPTPTHTHPHLGTLTQWSTLLLHSFSAGLSYTFSCSVPMNQTTCWSSQRELDKITRGPLKSIFDPWPPPPFIVGRQQQQRTSWLLIALNHGHNYINESSEREIDKVRFKP